MEWEVSGTETNRNVPYSFKSAPLRFGDWTNQLSTEELQLNPALAKMSFQGQTYCWKPLKRPAWAARGKSDAFSFFKCCNLLQSWGVFALWGTEHPDWLEMPRLRSQVQLYSGKKAPSKCFSHVPTQTLLSHHPALQTPTGTIICEPGATHFKEKNKWDLSMDCQRSKIILKCSNVSSATDKQSSACLKSQIFTSTRQPDPS